MKKLMILCSSLLLMCSCEKYLSVKPDAKLATIATLDDAQALLDYYPNINQSDIGVSEECADSYYLSDTEYSKRSESDQRLYRWEKDNLFLSSSKDWRQSYENIFTADAVLEALNVIPRNTSNAQKYDDVKGQALLLRGKTFLMLLWTWSLAYDSGTASKQLGVPLRLKADFNQKVDRSNLEQGYQQVMADLQQAVKLLPLRGAAPFRGNKLGAWGWLSRVCLSKRDYQSTYNYADSILLVDDTLMDFNDLNGNSTYPISQFNKEVKYDSRLATPVVLTATRAKIDTLLFKSYETNDLRKSIYFKKNSDGSYAFKGSYTGGATFFSGIATDELYLNKAEGLARNHQVAEAMVTLNLLLVKRFKKNTFVPLKGLNEAEILGRILLERRKELLFRGLRWMDIKRLNLEKQDILLKRIINGQVYLLPPNDFRYALAIPEDVIELSGIQDNPR